MDNAAPCEERADGGASDTSFPSLLDELTSSGAAPEIVCRFCYGNEGEDLISPCRCRGTQKYIHRSCLDSWRATRGWFALTHCSTCKAPFHLRLPHSSLSRFLVSASIRLSTAALLFGLLQLVPLGLGYLSTRDTMHSSIQTLCSESLLHCYCAGVWELAADILFAMGLGLEFWYWRWSLCAAIVIIKYAAILPAVARVVGFCHSNLHVLPPAFPVSLLPYATQTTLPSLLPKCPASWMSVVKEYMVTLACAAHASGLIATVAVGLGVSACVVFQALKSVGRLGKNSRRALVKELEVLDVEGEYSPPSFSCSQKRHLEALKVLS